MGERVTSSNSRASGWLAASSLGRLRAKAGYRVEDEMSGFKTRVVDATEIEFGELHRMLTALERLGWQVHEVPGISTGHDGRLRLVLVRPNQA